MSISCQFSFFSPSLLTMLCSVYGHRVMQIKPKLTWYLKWGIRNKRPHNVVNRKTIWKLSMISWAPLACSFSWVSKSSVLHLQWKNNFLNLMTTAYTSLEKRIATVTHDYLWRKWATHTFDPASVTQYAGGCKSNPWGMYEVWIWPEYFNKTSVKQWLH